MICINEKEFCIYNILKCIKMILDKFKNLNILTQTTIVSQFASPVAEVADEYFTYQLYQYSNFYVEIKYLKRNRIFYSVLAFSDNSPQLDLYLDEIDISS